MNKLSFKHWKFLKEWADFGFEKKSNATSVIISNDNYGPINPIDSAIIIDELYRLPPLGHFFCRYKMSNLLEWGNNIGALQVFISPLGSYKAVIRRKTKDLQGEDAWICKEVIPFDEDEINTKEIETAHVIYNLLNEIYEKDFDSPKKEYKDFSKLVHTVFSEVKRHYPSNFMFPIGMKKMSDDYYKIIYEFRGQGVEAPNRKRSEQLNIDIFWDKNKGLIKCWGYTIDSKVSQHTWEVQPSDFEEWFAPTQDIKKTAELIKIILLAF